VEITICFHGTVCYAFILSLIVFTGWMSACSSRQLFAAYS